MSDLSRLSSSWGSLFIEDQMAEPHEPLRPFTVALHMYLTPNAKFCDLSGRLPFQLSWAIGRMQLTRRQIDDAKHQTPVRILTTNSILDVPNALKHGLIEIVELEGIRKVKEGVQPVKIGEISNVSPPSVVVIGPASLANKKRPQLLTYEIDVTKLQGLEDGKRYMVQAGPLMPLHQTFWNGGITWWKYSSNLEQSVDVYSPGELEEIQIRSGVSMAFMAKAQVEEPPEFDFSVSMSPTTISLSEPQNIIIRVTATLKEETAYTIHTLRNNDQPHYTALHSSNNLYCFDVVDPSNNRVISGEPYDTVALTLDGANQRMSMARNEFRQIGPNMTVENTHTCHADGRELALRRGLRTPDLTTMVGRKWHLKLRPTDTWWTCGTIDALFGDRETIRKDIYTKSLVIESDARVEFSIVD